MLPGVEVRVREGFVEVRPFPPGVTPAVVSRHYRTAVQIFPNEWASVEAGLEMPCYPAEHAAVGEQVAEFCAKQIAAEREALEQHSVQPQGARGY